MKPKDEWIQKTMESLDNVSQAESNPYLFEKIINSMQQPESSHWGISKGLIWKLSLGFGILLLLNIASIKKYNSQKTGSINTHSSADNEYSFQFNYTY